MLVRAGERLDFSVMVTVAVLCPARIYGKLNTQALLIRFYSFAYLTPGNKKQSSL